MRILFINRFFHPDHSATSQILSDLAFELAADGRDVHVITSRQLYDIPDARLDARETIRGVHVTRVNTTEFGRRSLPGRAFDYASSYVAMARAALDLTRPDDIVIAKTDPPLLSILGRNIASKRGAKLINWLQDIYPEVAVEAGVPLIRSGVAPALIALRNRSLRAANANVVLGTAMAKRIADVGIAADRIRIINNWTDDFAITPLPPADNELRQQWRLGDKFIVGYSGNLGRTHDVDALLQAAKAFHDRRDIVFAFIGGGGRFNAVRKFVEKNKLGETVRFFPYQPRDALHLSLTLPDLHWLSLRPSLEGLIFPSKLYGIAAAGRPILALSAPDGEIAGLIARHHCGFTVGPNDTNGLIRAIETLAADDALRQSMGRSARAMLDANFTRRMALSRWRDLLDKTGT